MYVQWCCKGISGITDADVTGAMQGGKGLVCRWWLKVNPLPNHEIRDKLTRRNLDWHVNRYSDFDPTTSQPFCDGTPFISLTAGTVERDKYIQTNQAHPALKTALEFATDWGQTGGYVFFCYVIVALNPAVGVEAVAEEIRDLKTYRAWSAWNLEGEIAAKIKVPSNQIRSCAKIAADLSIVAATPNPAFVPPRALLNQRTLI